mmetsp:Transcript_9387/g.16675  ORF Transcript_9387/g.16675 Transcript_9387/m.16675 type:complete len:80 (-) Transcript_9387:189-428(-)
MHPLQHTQTHQALTHATNLDRTPAQSTKKKSSHGASQATQSKEKPHADTAGKMCQSHAPTPNEPTGSSTLQIHAAHRLY